MSSPHGPSSRYKAFISYNHRDLKFAKQLHAKLENFRFKTKESSGETNKPLFPVFLDENELKAGSTLSEAIQNSIRASDYLVVICSKNSAESKWVKAELAFMQSLNRDKDIIGVIPDKHGDETHIAELFGPASEHLAADFRPGKNKNLQLSKIAATIIGVELDDVYQRESRRKNKQMLSMGVGLSAIAILMSGLAANAYFSETEAVRQRQNSEEIIAFMIDEFRDDLEKLDQLDLLADVGEKAQDYFSDRDLNSLSDESILLQSRTLRQLADIDEKRGEIEIAIVRIQNAHLASEQMIKRLPKNKDAIKEHAKNADHWGYLEYQFGKLSKAKELFESAKQSYDLGAKYFPDDAELLWKSVVAEQNIGIMILQMGHADEARPYLKRTLEAVKTHQETTTLSEDELYEYAGMYTWYIRSLPDDTPISELYDTRQKQLQLFRDMRENGARTILNTSETLNVERAVVILLLQSGRTSEAESLMRSIQDEFKELIAHDPNNVGWRWHLMRSKLTLGLLHHDNGHKNDRNREISETIALAQKADGGTWGYTTDIGRRLHRLKAYRLYDEKSLEAALELLDTVQTEIIDRRKGVRNAKRKRQLQHSGTKTPAFSL